MVRRTEDRWRKLQGVLHDVAPLVVGKASEAAWKKWLQLPLELACRDGQLSVVERLLAAGAEPAASRRDKYDGKDSLSLIHSAVFGNNPGVLMALLKAGCRDDFDAPSSSALWAYRTPLLTAVWRKKTAMAEALLTLGANAAAADGKGLTPLHLASIREDVPMMRRLLGNDAVDMEAKTTAGLTPLYIGLCNRQVESVKFLVEAGAALVSPPHHRAPFYETEGRSCLFAAAEKGYNEMTGILIEAGADVHERIDGCSVMRAAARAGNASAVHALNDAGAPVVESDGDALLFCAVREAQAASTKALLERGTPVGVRTHAGGETPLHVAAGEGGADVVRVLLNHGADVASVDDEGKTPLHMAAKGGSAHVVRVLLDHGADAASVDGEGKAPACLVKSRYSHDDLDWDTKGFFKAFEYRGEVWEGEEEHAYCIKLMIENVDQDKRDKIWAPRRNLMMLVARHRKAAAAAAPPMEHGGGKRLARRDDGGAPAALPAGGGACEGGLGDGGTTTAEGAAAVGGEHALRSMVALLADLGEEHLLRRVVLFL